MAFDWFDLIVLFGIVQGLIVAVLLFVRGEKTRISVRLMATMLLVFSLLSGKIAMHTLGLWNTPTLRYFPLAIDLLIQPLLYLYVASLVKSAFKWHTQIGWHFLPACLFFLHALMVYAVVLPIPELAGKDTLAERWHYNLVKAIEDDLSVISAIAYGLLSFRLVSRYRRWLDNHTADSRYPTFSWLKNVLFVTALLGIGLLINIALDQFVSFNVNHFFHWQLFYVYLSGLIYYVAFRSLIGQALILDRNRPTGSVSQKPAVASRYSAEELQSAKRIIMDALDRDRLFLNSELTVQMLANHLKLTSTLVSETINLEFGKSFRTLINEFRIEEVKRQLTADNLSRLSILGIALECGFNSEASFYRLFKAATGQSPRMYMESSRAAAATAQPR